jgi:hypothetical protein
MGEKITRPVIATRTSDARLAASFERKAVEEGADRLRLSHSEVPVWIGTRGVFGQLHCSAGAVLRVAHKSIQTSIEAPQTNRQIRNPFYRLLPTSDLISRLAQGDAPCLSSPLYSLRASVYRASGFYLVQRQVLARGRIGLLSLGLR